MTGHRLAVLGLALLLVVAACGPSQADGDSSAWGDEAAVYFEALSLAYEDNDFYGVLDFYAAVAHVEKWRGAVRGGLPVADMLRWNSGDLAQQFEAVHLGGDGALTQVLWPRSGDQGAIVSTMENGVIAGETVFELAASLGRSLRATPDVIATYEGLYGTFAEAWSSDDADYLVRIYSPEAEIHDVLQGERAAGHPEIVALQSPLVWKPVVNTDPGGNEESAEGPAVYLGPRAYADDPQRAVGVYTVEDAAGCERRVAVRWVLDGELIVEEHRYWEVESFRSCAGGALPAGWWTGLGVPGPSDQVVTGVVRTDAGREIAIRNGTPLLEDLVEYGLARFALAGLDEPVLDTVTFEPSRSCAERSGRVVDDGTTRDLFLCIYESDLCPGTAACAGPTLSVRLAVLHELGHAWIIEHVGAETELRLLDLAGLETWDGLDAPWAERGAEYGAEVLAWGLLDESIPLVRLGAPPCAELEASFRLLTSGDPLRQPGDCPAM